MAANPCIYTLKDGRELTYDQMRKHLLDNYEQLKPIQDALQINRAGEVLQRQQSENGSTGSERGRMEQSKQGEETTQKGKEIGDGKGNEPPISITITGSDEEGTKVANAINDAHIEGKFGTDALDKVIAKLQDTNLEDIYNNVKKKINDGLIDLDNVRKRVLTTKNGSEIDQAALLYDLADLKGKEDALQKSIISETDEAKKIELQRQLTKVQDDMLDNALANRYVGRQASTIFRLRQVWVNKEMSIADMEQQYMASKGLDKLNPEQKKEVKAAYNAVKESRIKLENAKSELELEKEKNAKLLIENDKLKELKDKSTEQKKADRNKKTSETIAKSKERISKAKDELRQLRSGMNDITRVLPKTALAISKIAAEKVYQGVVKFDELVKNIYDDVKDIFPEWTEKDVAAHLLAKFDKDGNQIKDNLSEKYLKSKELTDESSKILREKIDAYKKAQKEVALKQFEWQKERRMDIIDKRPLKERVIDNILRWQRFCVLSYPATVVKLAAVVAQQLLLKPIKFAIQKFVTYPILSAVGAKNKASIWGNAEWQSIGKYYSAFVRNFALDNLKEQFSGIDTKELLYGKPMMYDEFNSAKGLLEMPGRAHGYIKSFIKNPEFAYAHEQQISFHISQMADLRKQLDNPDLSEEKRTELQNEYDKHDVTNEDVMERINKLSLEHAKWAILMNENKFVEKVQQFERESGIGGSILKSELPVVKIPVNYVGRAFATKYGLIQALIGKGKDKMPSIIRLAVKGSEVLTEEQANLLGRTLSLGTMGAAFYALGYMNRKNIKTNADGSIEINGVHISKNLIHSPEIESFLSGSETGAKFDQEKNKNAQNFIIDFMESDLDIAKKNPFMSMLQYGFLPNVASALINKKNTSTDTKLNKVETAIFKKVADMTIPGFIKQPASWMDTKEKGIHPMGTPIKRTTNGNELEKFWQEFEMGLPILRSNVPKSHKQ